MSQEVDWLNKYIVGSLCTHIVDSVITERWHRGKNIHKQQGEWFDGKLDAKKHRVKAK